VTKKELKQTITWHLDRHGVDRTRKLLDDMKELGFGWATRAGISLGVDDMMVPAEKASICDGTVKRTLEAQVKYENGEITVVEKFLKVTDEWSRTSEQVKEAAIKNFKENDPNNPVYMMSTSGARGNISQVRQLLAMRGLMADANGQLIDVPIQHCLREGMTVTDMLISGHGARKGVIDTALRTADSGYLYRRMDFAACNVVVRGDDCGTREFMSVNLKGLYSAVAPMKERLRGRVLAAPILDPRSGSLIHDTGHLVKALEADKVASIWKQCEKDGMKDLPALRVRSPLMCKLSQGICAKCYGEDLSTPGKLVVRGHPSGTIAAQSMGEPGTQLTMRTFHTGGAFEGKAGKAAQAKLAGTVRLLSESGKAIQAKTSAAVRQDSDPVAEWKRTPQGDIACVLAEAATLVVQVDGKDVQTASLVPGSLVQVFDGYVVSLGQVLYEDPVESSGPPKDDDLDTLAKPVCADEDGEVVVEMADSEASCIEGKANLIWVLQGACAEFDQADGCTLAVRPGDMVEAGVPLAQEWASTGRPGVPRFRAAPRSGRRDAGREQTMHGDPIPSGSQPHSTKESEENDTLCLRTDFDWFFMGGHGRATEYTASFEIPASLQKVPEVDRNLTFNKKYKALTEAAIASAADLRSPTVQAPEKVSVFTCVTENIAEELRDEAEEAEDDMKESFQEPPAVTVICTPPSLRASGSVLSIVSRTAKPEYVVPMGGLVVHLPTNVEGGSASILWSPEDIHRVTPQDMDNKTTSMMLWEALTGSNGTLTDAGAEMPVWADEQRVEYRQVKKRRPLFTTNVEGCFCLYRRPHSQGLKALSPIVVEEEDGVLRRECWDRVSLTPGSEMAADKEAANWECVVKPGLVFQAPSKYFLDDPSWWAPDSEGGVYFHQKLIPPGVCYIPKLDSLRKSEEEDLRQLNLRNDAHWRVVELLDDPRSEDMVKVLVRPARFMTLPASGLPLPDESRTLTSWSLPHSSGEVVQSSSPLAVAYEVVSSVSRHPSEPHCATVVPSAAADAVRSRKIYKEELGKASLTEEREWTPADLCVVQHSPLGPARPAGGGPAWKEAEPRHASPAAGQDQMDVPRRHRPSPRAGLVVKAQTDTASDTAEGRERATVVILGQDDVTKIPCKSRPNVSVGSLVRLKGPLSETDSAPVAGQVLQVEEVGPGDASEHKFVVTLRKGRAYLVTSRGRIQVRSGDVVQKGDLLGTEDLVVPRTTDIVQGLPRIEKIFEASGGAMQERLAKLWEHERQHHEDLVAAMNARNTIQQEIVAEIQSVYGEQGVSINSKHIEVVVRRMTDKCEILEGVGTSLQPGTLVDYVEIEALRALQPSGKIRARPVVRGLTSIGRDLHVLVAMGFREMDATLVGAVLNGSGRHRMQGIKENLMVGKAISVGNNFDNRAGMSKDGVGIGSINLNNIPEFCDAA